MIDGLSRASRCAETMLQMVLPASTEFAGDFAGVLSLPLERSLGEVQVMLGKVELTCAELEVGHVDQDADGTSCGARLSRAGQAHDEEKWAAVQQWLDDTAPAPELTPSDLRPPAAVRASSHFTSAFTHMRSVPVLHARATLAAGTGLARLAGGRADLGHAARDLLESTIAVAREARLLHVAGAAAFELVRLARTLGLEQSVTVSSLLLYQSTVAHQWLEQLLVERIDDRRGKLASFWRLDRFLANELVNPGAVTCESWPYRRCQEYLRGTVQMRRLSCSTPVNRMLDTMPSSVCFCVLAFSPSHQSIFCSVFNKNCWRSARVESLTLGTEGFAAFEKLASNMSAISKRLGAALPGHERDADYDKEAAEGDDRSNEEIARLTKQLRQQLGPLIARASAPEVRSARSAESGEETKGDASAEFEWRAEHLVILADELLARLPLEALFVEGGQEQHFKTVSRDVSVHMFGHRLAATSNFGELTKADAETVQEPVWSKRTGTAGAIVDPRAEASSIVSAFQSASNKGQCIAHVGPTNGIPSESTWQEMLRGNAGQAAGQSFMYLGLAPLLSHAAPATLTGLNMERTWHATLLDRAMNDDALRNKCKRDAHLSGADLELESMWETVGLLSLAGINSIVANQWPASIHGNLALFAEALAGGGGLGGCKWSSTLWNRVAMLHNNVHDSSETHELNGDRFKCRVLLNAVSIGVPDVLYP
eukprot:CAMPEP_0202118414 /NCGR_PEP_ID=MMETSP0965-20130614/43137_1 /ASSEMBLY_ACC=CAM_ASM_000507 /TAXON_ID=4773 /ORGANISM="Schizochytrium aggregatum, Strain ATCC28209" /LENGTH=710 /DNA_ID=CAMNT_0048688337 /DNA_START=19 /DNA_END=2151 /DNA_ORIENTATION=-